MNGARRPRFRAIQRDHIGSVDPHALKIPARGAEYSLAKSALSLNQHKQVQVYPSRPAPPQDRSFHPNCACWFSFAAWAIPVLASTCGRTIRKQSA